MAANPEGLHIWLTLPDFWSRQDFGSYIRTQGLALVPADAFTTTPGMAVPNAMRVALGVAPDHGRLEAALKALAGALKTRPVGAFADVV